MYESQFGVGWYSRNTRRDHAEHVGVTTRSSVGVNTSFSAWIGIFLFRHQPCRQQELPHDIFSSVHGPRLFGTESCQTMSGHQPDTISKTGEVVIFLFALPEISKKSDGTRTPQESYVV